MSAHEAIVDLLAPRGERQDGASGSAIAGCGISRTAWSTARFQVAEIDALLAAHAQNWRVERMAVLDRLVLRLAVYEFLTAPDTPPKVIINEALELARSFSGDEAVGFVNGILDAVRKHAADAESRSTGDRSTMARATGRRRSRDQQRAAARQPRRADEARRRSLSAPLRAHAHRPRARRPSTAARRRRSSRPRRSQTRTAGPRSSAIRSFGKANFLVLSDGRSRIQVYVRQDSLPERDFQIFKLLDFGD